MWKLVFPSSKNLEYSHTFQVHWCSAGKIVIKISISKQKLFYWHCCCHLIWKWMLFFSVNNSPFTSRISWHTKTNEICIEMQTTFHHAFHFGVEFRFVSAIWMLKWKDVKINSIIFKFLLKSKQSISKGIWER